MSDKEVYLQKLRAQLDEWKADVDKLKAKATRASAGARLERNKQIEVLESNIEEGKTKLSELSRAGESAWDSLKSAVSDAAAKFNALPRPEYCLQLGLLR